jgi:hypothetical protein
MRVVRAERSIVVASVGVQATDFACIERDVLHAVAVRNEQRHNKWNVCTAHSRSLLCPLLPSLCSLERSLCIMSLSFTSSNPREKLMFEEAQKFTHNKPMGA